MVYYLGKRHLGPYRVDFQNLDGDPTKIEAIDALPDDGLFIMPGLSAVTSGRPVKPDNVPTRVEWRGPAKFSPTSILLGACFR